MNNYFEILEEKNYQPDSIADLDRGETLWGCDEKSDQAWLLSDRDVWYANPSYEGLPVPHPLDEVEGEDILAYQINEAVAFFREVTHVWKADKTDYSEVPF
jgi:hypothetical protein